ncbi:hypothetical protein HYH03_001441 [Edaphochlamys debaryana]|uniref:Uncharacterized protein n=1 Tax=Edaphochlamys debaryana TaxID=47281 RepID=A0A835YLD1_9CHLO|nr:hypothetical protein HYH03_001441 [Edaphochlamys debaryana]|eukprot:KAG2500675.1 hypothetical protein HYH03_001441 [Edaphochlamys debaryana]
MQGMSRSQGRSGRGRGSGRRSSSEDVSDDPSWASGAEFSDDDSGSGAPMPAARRTSGAAGARQHPGVHVTVVRRGADGRPLDFPGQEHMLPGPGGRSSPEGAARQNGGRARGAYREDAEGWADGEGEAGSDGEADSPAVGRRRRTGSGSGGERQFSPEEEGDSGEEGQRRPLRRRGGGAYRDPDGEWEWDGAEEPHPGMAPPDARGSRSKAPPGRPLPPAIAGYVATPLGPHPVFRAGSVAGVRAAAAVAPVRPGPGAVGPKHEPVRAATPPPPGPPKPAAAVATAAAPTVAAPAAVAPAGPAGPTADPLDLLAQLACEALAPKPEPADEEPGVGLTAEVAEGGVQRPERAVERSGACRPGSSEGSAHSGGAAAAARERRSASRCGAGREAAEAHEARVGDSGPGDEEEQCSAPPAGLACGPMRPLSPLVAAKAEGAPFAGGSECVSASTQNSGRGGATTGAAQLADPLSAAVSYGPAATNVASAPHGALAPGAQPKQPPASPHSSAALLASDTVDWGAAGDGEADAVGGLRRQPWSAGIVTQAPTPQPVPTAATSSVATAPSAGTATLPSSAAAAPVLSAAGGATSALTVSDGAGSALCRPASADAPAADAEAAYRQVAAAANIAMAATLLRAPAPQQLAAQPPLLPPLSTTLGTVPPPAPLMPTAPPAAAAAAAMAPAPLPAHPQLPAALPLPTLPQLTSLSQLPLPPPGLMWPGVSPPTAPPAPPPLGSIPLFTDKSMPPAPLPAPAPLAPAPLPLAPPALTSGALVPPTLAPGTLPPSALAAGPLLPMMRLFQAQMQMAQQVAAPMPTVAPAPAIVPNPLAAAFGGMSTPGGTLLDAGAASLAAFLQAAPHMARVLPPAMDLSGLVAASGTSAPPGAHLAATLARPPVQ